MTAIFIPTLNRPYKMPSIVENIKEATLQPHKIYFIVEAEDTASQEAVSATGEAFIINKLEPSYAGCINTAYAETKEPYFFMGADDLSFKPNWLLEALKTKNETGKGVVGTNDLHNGNTMNGTTATHSFVTREYIEKFGGTIDNSFPVLYGYKHNYVDTEFVCTAKHRNQFAPCITAHVEHMHWGTGLNPKDATYQKGDDVLAEDQALFHKRKALWGGDTV